MPLFLYDLAGADEEARFSLCCWRIKMALRHKGLAWRLTDKDDIVFSGSKTVPVLVDGNRSPSDSWTIARYLDERYPEPSLLGVRSARRTLCSSGSGPRARCIR